ncbi:hypothetical protein GCM10007298_30330 [Williamsia phyllosphaerae]|uniref:Uncharacterized protein n=1 Tax=Williamsia phyllosphaerae TaxID=885042 RepID=A0ABQ1V1M4_9NOCA|nr:hypothetical protein GCM10007298_30330 [Williamsia phyllosphaerae]
MLAAQQRGDLHGEAAEHHVGGVDDVPRVRDVTGLGGIGGHRCDPFRVIGAGQIRRRGAPGDQWGPGTRCVPCTSGPEYVAGSDQSKCSSGDVQGAIATDRTAARQSVSTDWP